MEHAPLEEMERCDAAGVNLAPLSWLEAFDREFGEPLIGDAEGYQTRGRYGRIQVNLARRRYRIEHTDRVASLVAEHCGDFSHRGLSIGVDPAGFGL